MRIRIAEGALRGECCLRLESVESDFIWSVRKEEKRIIFRHLFLPGESNFKLTEGWKEIETEKR